MSRIALTLAFLFLLWRLFAPAEPEIAYEDQAAVVATSTLPRIRHSPPSPRA